MKVFNFNWFIGILIVHFWKVLLKSSLGMTPILQFYIVGQNLPSQHLLNRKQQEHFIQSTFKLRNFCSHWWRWCWCCCCCCCCIWTKLSTRNGKSFWAETNENVQKLFPLLGHFTQNWFLMTGRSDCAWIQPCSPMNGETRTYSFCHCNARSVVSGSSVPTT